jgi:hypothetical protein
MLNVTAAARDRLLSKLVRKQAADDVALRFTRKRKGWKLRLDDVRPDDTTFTYAGRTVLLLDAAVSKAMAALTLDVSRSATGARLRLHRIPRESA